MRCLLLNQFYVPDPAPTGKYLHDVAIGLVQRGHEARVLCSRRSYDGAQKFPARETLSGIQVTRLPSTAFGRRTFVGKISDYSSYYAISLARLVFAQERPDLILSLTTPPYIGLLGRAAAIRHKCAHVHWIMDLYPDVLFAHGMIRKHGLMDKVLSQLTRLQLKGAARVLALGPHMAKRLGKYVATTATETNVDYVPLWSDAAMEPWPEGEPNKLRRERGWKDDEVVLLYSGNMGLGHRFGEFLQGAKELKASGLRWVFAGGGKRQLEIETAARNIPEAKIEFLRHVPQAQLKEHLSAADVHLLSLDSAWQGSIVPSKLQGSFAVGRPVIYVGGLECETAGWILESGGGWVVSENDIHGLVEAVKQAMDPIERRKRGQAALRFAQARFRMQTNCSRIIELLEQSDPALQFNNARSLAAASAR